MAISLSGTDLVLISATSNTTTTNTTFNANAPNDSNYFLPNSILAGVSTGVTIDGFGLFLWATLADKNLDMINDGTIAVTQPAAALTLVATGGAVSYLGAGTISSANGPGLAMGNRDAGTVVATISNADLVRLRGGDHDGGGGGRRQPDAAGCGHARRRAAVQCGADPDRDRQHPRDLERNSERRTGHAGGQRREHHGRCRRHRHGRRRRRRQGGDAGRHHAQFIRQHHGRHGRPATDRARRRSRSPST